MNLTLTSIFLVAAIVCSPAHSQTTTATPGPPVIRGKTFEGKPFQLSSLKGKVVLVMFWSTDCAVCRDKMPELRQNYEGWKNKPFEMVLVNSDRKFQDVEAYEKIIARTVPANQRFVQLWTGDLSYQDNMGRQAQLPSTIVLDRNGKVVERYQGRIPAEAWDKIAELL